MDIIKGGLPIQKPRTYSALWKDPAPAWRERLGETVHRLPGRNKVRVFFRADDIGAGGHGFRALCALFRQHGVPLALAVVPAWLTETRLAQLFATAPLDEELWGWHQHGWRHVNWQKTGKKSEFGDQRPLEKQWKDVWQGHMRLMGIFQERLLPVFTPPWNRLSPMTLQVLHQMGFKAVSTTDPLPKTGKNVHRLKNFRIGIDLHTRKNPDGVADYDQLLHELIAAFSKDGPVGIMIHHQRMTPFAFAFLDELIRRLQSCGRAEIVSFDDLLQGS
jgi:peptidoglycan/xylan/chitin deacetylase (PgdA/CDA1 family)